MVRLSKIPEVYELIDGIEPIREVLTPKYGDKFKYKRGSWGIPHTDPRYLYIRAIIDCVNYETFKRSDEYDHLRSDYHVYQAYSELDQCLLREIEGTAVLDNIRTKANFDHILPEQALLLINSVVRCHVNMDNMPKWRKDVMDWVKLGYGTDNTYLINTAFWYYVPKLNAVSPYKKIIQTYEDMHEAVFVGITCNGSFTKHYDYDPEL